MLTSLALLFPCRNWTRATFDCLKNSCRILQHLSKDDGCHQRGSMGGLSLTRNVPWKAPNVSQAHPWTEEHPRFADRNGGSIHSKHCSVYVAASNVDYQRQAQGGTVIVDVIPCVTSCLHVVLRVTALCRFSNANDVIESCSARAVVSRSS